MSRYQPRHRKENDSSVALKRTVTTAGFGVLATAAIAGTSAAAWACPTGSHANTAASVHHAVVYGQSSAHANEQTTKHSSTHSTASRSAHTTAAQPSSHEPAGATRGASQSDPDGMSNGGADKPWGGAAANDDVDGNNGSGNDADCEDDNNGVGTPGHCGATPHGNDSPGEHETHGVPKGEEGMTVVTNGPGTTQVVAGAGVVRTTVQTTTGSTTGVTSTGGMTSGAAAAAPEVLGEQFSRGVSRGTSAGGTATSPNSTQLPFTGSDDLPILAMIGAAGVVTGAGVVRAARRRRPLLQEPAV